MTSPRFSIVVPTRDRNDLLSQCLERLASSAQPEAGEYEVIVTDDSLREAARPLIASRFPWARWVSGPQHGPAANRNAGAGAAGGDVLVFLDDDCLPEAGLLAGYARALRDDTAAYEGRITCTDGLTSARQTAPLNTDGGALWSCNFAIRRTVFTSLGGFDVRFPLAHMEDVDLRTRILGAGHSIVFVPEASVDHPPRRLPWGTRLARMHQSGVLYMVLHPPVRSLPWFLQNQLRARVSRVIHLPLTLDSLTALASIPFELASIAWHWRAWMRWAHVAAGTPR